MFNIVRYCQILFDIVKYEQNILCHILLSNVRHCQIYLHVFVHIDRILFMMHKVKGETICQDSPTNLDNVRGHIFTIRCVFISLDIILYR